MTHAQLTQQRTTVVTSAFVAAVIAIAITVSALLIAPSFVSGPASPFDAARDARLDRAEQAGLAWQERYEQIHPTRLAGSGDRAEQGGLQWQERYEQMYPTR
jgi:hypothetical protein